MSRLGLVASAILACLCSPDAALAQETLEAQTGTPPEKIDILVDPTPEAQDYENCEEDQDAATITGEIIVCRQRSGDENRLYDRETAARRHAERTKHANDPQAPDMFGIPNHGIVVARGCFIPPCPPPAAILIDLEAIPEAPAGSDADRVGRGLAPRGYSTGRGGAKIIAGDEAGRQHNAEELGLPPPPPGEDGVNPSGSASPADDPSS